MGAESGAAARAVPPPGPEPGRGARGPRLAAASAGAAVVVSFVVALQWSLGGARGLGAGFVAELPVWLAWAALTPLIFEAGRRWPLDGGRRLRALPVHLLLAPALTLVVIGAAEAVRRPLGLGWGASWGDAVWQGFRATFGFFGLIYFALLALHHALAYRDAYEKETARQLRTEAELARARLDLVRSQLQPHFLFNTLNTISSLVTRDPKSARAMVAHLSDLLRTMLERPARDAVPLEAELRFARAYLEIQRLRFRDRLEVEIDVAPAALRAAVPPMLLQPLLENALEHGLPERGPARVEVRAALDDEGLRVSVADNGPGFGGRPPRPRGGLGSVASLLDATHAGRHRLAFRERQGGGAEVLVRLPGPPP